MCVYVKKVFKGRGRGWRGGLARGRALENALNGDDVDVAADDMMR